MPVQLAMPKQGSAAGLGSKLGNELPRVSRAASPEVAMTADAARVHGNWLSVVTHLEPKYGGLSTVVPQLASLLSESEQFHVDLEAFCLPGERYLPPTNGNVSVSYWTTNRRQWLLDRSLAKVFRRSVAQADGVHIHGLWEQSTLIAARSAHALRKPYIVSAHGMLDPWALGSSRLKKQVYAALFERSNLAGATCLHALTEAEARNYRTFGGNGSKGTPIAVIPNGVDVPDALSPELFLKTFPAAQGKRLILFLGRLHPQKGLDLLTRAWSTVASDHKDACLVLAGPAEDATRAQLEQFAAKPELAGQVLLTGMLERPLVWSALAAAECFTLPSFSEGLSVAMLEAMGAGVPVIVTGNCNIPEVVAYRTGWQICADASELQVAFRECLRNSPEENKMIGLRGAALVARRYSWKVVAAQMAELYTWVQGGARPHSFELQS